MRWIAVVFILPAAALAVGLMCWVVYPDDTVSQFAPHVPAECSWKEIDQPGDWQQTCDDNQKRLQR